MLGRRYARAQRHAKESSSNHSRPHGLCFASPPSSPPLRGSLSTIHTGESRSRVTRHANITWTPVAGRPLSVSFAFSLFLSFYLSIHLSISFFLSLLTSHPRGVCAITAFHPRAVYSDRATTLTSVRLVLPSLYCNHSRHSV